MARCWTEEQKARQAALIRGWRPWEQSTGPRMQPGKDRSKMNRDQGAHRPRLRELSKVLRAVLGRHAEVLVEVGGLHNADADS